MRGAPPVQWVCGRDAPAMAATAALSALATATLAGWVAWHAGWSLAVTLPLLLTVSLAAAGVGWRWAAAVGMRRLRWDGRTWWLDEMPVAVAVMLDLGAWMLLRAQGDGCRAWLPVTLRRTGAPAHLVRAALLAHAGRLAGNGGGGPGLHG